MNKYTHFYINIKSCDNRNFHMLKQFSDYKITNYHRVEAITPQLKEYSFYEKPKNLTKNEFACVLSHKKAIDYGLDNNLDYFMVMEDDCVFREKIDYDYIINNAPPDWEIISLMREIKKLKFRGLYERKRDGNTGFYIVKGNIQKFAIEEINDVSDKFLNKKYNVYNFLFPYLVSLVVDSTIKQSHKFYQDWNTSNALKIKNYDKIKIDWKSFIYKGEKIWYYIKGEYSIVNNNKYKINNNKFNYKNLKVNIF